MTSLPRSEVRELGEIDVVSMALKTPAIHLEGHTVFQRNSQPAGELYPGLALLLGNHLVDYQTLATVTDSHGGLVDGADELAATVRPGT